MRHTVRFNKKTRHRATGDPRDIWLHNGGEQADDAKQILCGSRVVRLVTGVTSSKTIKNRRQRYEINYKVCRCCKIKTENQV